MYNSMVEYVVQGFYGPHYGWEDLTSYFSREEAEEGLKVYDENEPCYRHRIVKEGR